MTTHNSRYGWMALGGMVCLFGVVMALKMRDGNLARAEAKASPPVPEMKETAEPQLLPPIQEAEEIPQMPKDGPPLPELPRPGEIIPAAAAVPAPPTDPMLGPPTPPSRAILIPAGIVPPPPGTADVPAAVPASAGPVPASIPVPAATVPAGNPLPPIGTQAVPPLSESQPTLTSVPQPTPVLVPAPPTTPAIRVTPAPVAAPAATPVVVTPTPAVKATPATTALPAAPPAIQVEQPTAEAQLQTRPYKVRQPGENLRSLARKTLGSSERWPDLCRLNPTYAADHILPVGCTVQLPADARFPEDIGSYQPLPSLRPRPPARPKAAMPLTGTYQLTLNERNQLVLPAAILEQLGNPETILLSPGSDRCLWLTSQVHLDRLQAKLDRSPARYSDVRGFMRLYYAQTVKVPVTNNQVHVNDRLIEFAGLQRELVLVGIDDHFEVWDLGKWRHFTQTRKVSTNED